MKAVNLIPAHHIHAREQRRRVRTWTTAGAVYAIVLIAAVAMAQGLWGQADRALADRLAELEADAAEARDTLRTLEPRLEQATQELQASRALAVQPDWSLLLVLLGEVRGEQIALNRIHLGPQRGGGRSAGDVPVQPEEQRQAYRVEISGIGENQQAVSQFVLRLENAEVFEDVKLAETSRTTVNDQSAVAFRVRGLLDERVEGRR